MKLREMIEQHESFPKVLLALREELPAFADVLEEASGPDRIVRETFAELGEGAGLPEYRVRDLLTVLVSPLGLVTPVEIDGKNLPGLPGWTASDTAYDVAPTISRVGRHRPKNQNEHLSAIKHSSTSKKELRLIALEAHVRIAWSGLKTYGDDPRFGDHEAELDLAASYLAGTTGVSVRKVRECLVELDRLGYLTRVNRSEFGKTNETGRYRPTIPSNLREQSHNR